MNPTPSEVWQAALYICGTAALAAVTLLFCGFTVVALFLGIGWLASLFARPASHRRSDGVPYELTDDGRSRITRFPNGSVGTTPLDEPVIPESIHVDRK